ncbi:prolyl oligopeptidase family serine peptidase [Dermabacteraceae bacterium TAE3-ERU5]|nr:prolyl oligopeptidase family serine peptidase [Dermabacteraceae bacterium TAE3-ERU5]
MRENLRPALPANDGSSDPWLWLEEIESPRALDWVREHNRSSEQEIDADGLSDIFAAQVKEILDSSERIPHVVKRGEYAYNFWQDEAHPKGIWRRAPFSEYAAGNPTWDVLLDVDALNREEGEDWVWHGASLLRENGTYPLALISLSHGGSDADVTREFDLVARRFVPESEGGFFRPAAKGELSWIDRDSVTVYTDFGPDSLTLSGYARQGRIWRRGQALTDAEMVAQAGEDDNALAIWHEQTPGYERTWVNVSHTFYTSTTYLLRDGAPQRIDVPDHAQVSAFRDTLLILPRKDWELNGTTYLAGSLLATSLTAYLAGEREVQPLFTPDSARVLQDLCVTANYLLLTLSEHVNTRLHAVWHDGEDWVQAPVFTKLTGTVSARAVDREVSDEVWLTAAGFLSPASLYLGDLGGVSSGEGSSQRLLRSEPSHFSADGLRVEQHFALSDDGTRIPYYQVGPENPHPEAPTLLYGYGGFEVSLQPAYYASIGKTWCERGGTFVLANIRGGGEYGPRWHQAALREKRPRAYEDFAAVAKDLIARGVTQPSRLACQGGSNGGLLTGNMLASYPELFGAIVIQVPLIDMKRYTKLLAGYSWMAEYGDPEGEDWDYLRNYSPYHLLDEATEYPPTLVTTSTRDDRVHPGHARKLVAALESIGKNVRLWENVEGGHGGAADNAQRARMTALMMAFLWQQVGAGAPGSATE